MTEFQWQVVLALCRIILSLTACTDKYLNNANKDTALLEEALKRNE